MTNELFADGRKMMDKQDHFRDFTKMRDTRRDTMETIVLMILSAVAGACMGCLMCALCVASGWKEEMRRDRNE